MKKKSILLIPMLLLSAMMNVGCSSDEEPNGSLRTRSIENSGCKQGNNAKVQSRASDRPDLFTETITLTAQKGGWLRVEHKDALFPCCIDNIAVQVSMEDNLITAQENMIGSDACNCICPYDINFEVGKLTEGNYTLIVETESFVRLKKEIHYSNNYNETIVIRNIK